MGQPQSSRRDLLDFLDHAESLYPVETWEIDGLHIWPLIKIDLFFRFVNSEKRDKALLEGITKQRTAVHIKAVNVIVSFIRFASLLLKKKKSITTFFSDSSGHRVMYHDVFIDRYFKPIVDFMRADDTKFSYLTINDDSENLKRYPSDEPIFFIYRYLLGAKLWQKLFTKKRKKVKLEGYSKFLVDLNDSRFRYLYGEKNYTEHIQRKVTNVLAFSSIAKVLIKKHSPKVIFELCYYSTLRFGLNHAAFQAGVRTVEIQHGGMGRDHVSYSGWSKLPKEGYNLLPQTFWLWDESSKQLIEKWTQGHRYHKAVLGGNPWLSFVKKSSDTFSFPRGRPIILYTLQYSEIPSHVIDAIKLTPAHFQWWIRLHPRKLASKSIVENILNNSGIDPDRYEIERATSYPLPAILLNAYVHLSGSSGAIIEAAQMGVFSLILEEMGTIYYSELIKKGLAKATLNTEVLLESILMLKNQVLLEGSNEELYKPLIKRLVPLSNKER